MEEKINVILMSGIPGSGKTHKAQKFVESHPDSNVIICSADDYFEGRPLDPALLAKAHGECLRRYVAQLMFHTEFIIVDNTNTTAMELAPYVALAQAYDADVTLVTITIDPYFAYKRNVHGVPLDICRRMAKNIEERKLPHYWRIRHEVVKLDGNGKS